VTAFIGIKMLFSGQVGDVMPQISTKMEIDLKLKLNLTELCVW
jgi:hypothetical protein